MGVMAPCPSGRHEWRAAAPVPGRICDCGETSWVNNSVCAVVLHRRKDIIPFPMSGPNMRLENITAMDYRPSPPVAGLAQCRYCLVFEGRQHLSDCLLSTGPVREEYVAAVPVAAWEID